MKYLLKTNYNFYNRVQESCNFRILFDGRNLKMQILQKAMFNKYIIGFL